MREWFKARNIWGGAFLALSDAEAGRLAKALWTYTMTGQQPNLSAAEKATFAMFQMTLDQDSERESEISTKRAAAGSAGGKQKEANKANARFATKAEANEAKATNKSQSQNQNQINSYDDDDVMSRTREDEDDRMVEAIQYGFARSLARDATPEEAETLATIGRLLGFGPDMLAEAIRIAAKNGARNILGYTRAILNEWKREEVTTPEEIEEYRFMYGAETGKTDYGSGDPDQMEKARKRRKEKHAEETA